MKIGVEYFENDIILNDNTVFTIEIENKKYFYRFVKDLCFLNGSFLVDSIKFFGENSKEKSEFRKIKVFINYFDFDLNSKKYSNDIFKFLLENLDDMEKSDIIKTYNKLIQIYNRILNNIDLPLSVSNDSSIESITKLMKIVINEKDNLLENLLLLIDLEKMLSKGTILFFVNLKQYLSTEELMEFYKYSLYNQVQIILVDSQSYGVCNNYEKKLIIDENLDEFML